MYGRQLLFMDKFIVMNKDVSSYDDWREVLENKLKVGKTYDIDLVSGFTPTLKNEGGNHFVDFQGNKYLITYKNGFVLYKKSGEDDKSLSDPTEIFGIKES